MTISKFKHFENLWEAAEQLASIKLKNVELTEVINEVTTLLSNLPNSSSKSDDLGRILFLISLISQKENINVFSALNNQLI